MCCYRLENILHCLTEMFSFLCKHEEVQTLSDHLYKWFTPELQLLLCVRACVRYTKRTSLGNKLFYLQSLTCLSLLCSFVLGAVSPAVVVPSMLLLQKDGYGVEQGIPTLLMAAGSFDDILAITGFTTCLGMAFATGDLHFVPVQSLGTIRSAASCVSFLEHFGPPSKKLVSVEAKE